MNPFRWKAEHGVALVVSMLVGAVTGPAVGYTFEIVARPPWARFALLRWLREDPENAIAWAVIAALVVGGTVYATRLSSQTR
jgi:hypothetical protein